MDIFKNLHVLINKQQAHDEWCGNTVGIRVKRLIMQHGRKERHTYMVKDHVIIIPLKRGWAARTPAGMQMAGFCFDALAVVTFSGPSGETNQARHLLLSL